MAKLRLKIALSLDGFVAGPDQSLDDPLGKNGERLHDWAFAEDRSDVDARIRWSTSGRSSPNAQ